MSTKTFGKLFAKKKRQTTKVKLADDKESEIQAPTQSEVETQPSQVQQTVKQIQKQEEAAVIDKGQNQKKERKVPNINWFDDGQDSDQDQIPEARPDLIKDRKQVQSKKKKEEANKHGQEYWDDQAVQGAQNLVQKRTNQQIEKERIKKQQSQILSKAKTNDEIFDAYKKISQLNGPIKPAQLKNTGMKLAQDEFISLEEQTQMAKIGKKKAAAMSSNAKNSENAAKNQQAIKTNKHEQSKFKNQFRDLGGDRDSDEEDEKKKDKNKFVIGGKKPGEGYQKKSHQSRDKGWTRGTGQVEKPNDRKFTSKKQDNGFQLGGGIVEKPNDRKFTSKQQDNGFQFGGGIVEKPRHHSKENDGFNRNTFGSGQVEQSQQRPFKKKQFDGVGFSRQKFGTGKASEFKQGKPRQPRSKQWRDDGGDQRKNKNDAWSRGGGGGGGGVSKKSQGFFNDNKRNQKQETTKQLQQDNKMRVKREAKVLVNENKNENCWDEDL